MSHTVRSKINIISIASLVIHFVYFSYKLINSSYSNFEVLLEFDLREREYAEFKYNTLDRMQKFVGKNIAFLNA